MRPITKEDIEALVKDPNSRKLCWRDGHEPPPRFVAKMLSGRKLIFESDEKVYVTLLDGSWGPPINEGSDILIATPVWPTLGLGQQWYNPENLTPEQMGEGWRPLLVGETVDELVEYFYTPDKIWLRSVCFTPHTKWTYRTRAPLPTPRHRVKLRPSDLPGGCVWFQVDTGCDVWVISGVGNDAIYANGRAYRWDALMFGPCKWSTDRNATDWKPFWKEV